MSMTLTEAQDTISRRWVELTSKAKAHFANLGREAKDEAVENVMFLTWHNVHALIEQGRCDDSMITTTFLFAIRQTRAGRVMKTVKDSKFRELFGHAHCIHAGLAIDAYVSQRDTIPDIVSFRVDVPAWIDSLL